MKKEPLSFPERWSIFKFLKNSIFYYCLRGGMSLLAVMPMFITMSAGRFAGFFGYYFLRGYRERARKHMTEALGTDYSTQQIDALIKKMFSHMGRGAGEALNSRYIIKHLSRYVEFEGDSKETYLSAFNSGKGVVFCAGHIGNWELFSKIMAHIRGPIYIVARKTFDPRVTRLIGRFRGAGAVVPLWRDGRRLKGAISDVLRRGDVMGFLIDQDLKVPGIFVPFFGKPAHTPLSPAKFALDFDTELILGIMRRYSKKYHISIDKIDVPRDMPKDEAIYRITADITKRFEDAIKVSPEQWIWMHRRWRQRSETATPLLNRSPQKSPLYEEEPYHENNTVDNQ